MELPYARSYGETVVCGALFIPFAWFLNARQLTQLYAGEMQALQSTYCSIIVGYEQGRTWSVYRVILVHSLF